MNALYLAIIAGSSKFDLDLEQPWQWAKAEQPGVLTLLSPYKTGTVTLTQGSVNGVFSVAPAVSQTGCWLKMTDLPEFFRVATHIAGSTAFTIDFEYTDVSGVYSFLSIRTDYTLTIDNIIRPIGPMRVYRSQSTDNDNRGKIEGFDEIPFTENNPLHKIETGVPTQFCIISNSQGVIKVRFNKYVDNTDTGVNTRIEYPYIPVPTLLSDAGTSIPLIPIQFRPVLSSGTAHQLCIDKADSKSDFYQKDTTALLKAMIVSTNRTNAKLSRRRGQLTPRPEQSQRSKYWPTSG